jgi:lipopolysaccharide/colanic/teichoic acid biosynthesis glycosyltransferase
MVLPFPWWKRVMDIPGALAVLVLAAPLMGAIALAIKLTSRGPVFFTQRRAGAGGRPFRLYKFRTMTPDAEARKDDLLHLNERRGPVFKMKRDPRVTTAGRFLRRLSLDELPQLFNVLRGDMSLVGPRPLPLAETGRMAVWQRRRLQVKPGVTGLWQVTSRNKSCFDEWVRLDIEYIEERSLWLDCKILLKTIPAVLSCKGAH